MSTDYTPELLAMGRLLERAVHALEAMAQSGPANPIREAWACPIHKTVRYVPAGVSKTSGKPYPEFWRCGDFSCPQKPPAGYRPPVEARTAPITPQVAPDSTPAPSDAPDPSKGDPFPDLSF